MKRVSVVGISGSGKTTLARTLAARLRAPHVELDAIHHQPDWEPLPRPEFRERVQQALAGETWVCDGNYSSKVQDIVWDAADTVVWIDLPRRTILPRLAARTLRRMWTREELWNGNRERWVSLFDPRPEYNILLWMLTHHGVQSRRNASAFESERWRHIDKHRLRSPDAVARFLAREGVTETEGSP